MPNLKLEFRNEHKNLLALPKTCQHGPIFAVRFMACYPAWKSKESTPQTRRNPPDIIHKQLSTTVSCSWRANSALIQQMRKRNSARSRNKPNKHSTTCTQS